MSKGFDLPEERIPFLLERVHEECIPVVKAIWSVLRRMETMFQRSGRAFEFREYLLRGRPASRLNSGRCFFTRKDVRGMNVPGEEKRDFFLLDELVKPAPRRSVDFQSDPSPIPGVVQQKYPNLIRR